MPKKALLTAAAAIVSAGALLHTPWARPLLRRMGGCPVERLSPAQIEAAQGRAFRKLRGASPAPDRPALGFKLEETTLAEVRAWALQQGLSCETARDGAFLSCQGPRDDFSFGFRLRDLRLVNVTTLRTGLAEDAARADFRGLTAELSRR